MVGIGSVRPKSRQPCVSCMTGTVRIEVGDGDKLRPVRGFSGTFCAILMRFGRPPGKPLPSDCSPGPPRCRRCRRFRYRPARFSPCPSPASTLRSRGEGRCCGAATGGRSVSAWTQPPGRPVFNQPSPRTARRGGFHSIIVNSVFSMTWTMSWIFSSPRKHLSGPGRGCLLEDSKPTMRPMPRT